eukprot:SAG11_NODE_14396_length_613_cov_1.289883_1_plen_56_part_00
MHLDLKIRPYDHTTTNTTAVVSQKYLQELNSFIVSLSFLFESTGYGLTSFIVVRP